ncbi:CRP/FNR family transcriptional regulator, nitrogen fixation regulation protein [Bradyrhizobium sp. Ghvi]|uniref:helix-turn-helix domain-containing protein n=1 Tax=Bradyrhizobium sp. Ghvi TaxID=1855319 RepID=UPI0008DED432|nr:helix-turn-helix domain-containing protein [Bradyrhizobium sp. Ghvi]SFQ19310.1 CRP/FNR family transcriptional regulator, nitrogen fixation regulation protein [Bradyrhizobium sp. Ghvi]
MLVSITTDQRSCRNALNEFGISSLSNPIVSSSEFTYKKGRTIYIEGDSAEYVYQVMKGAARTHKLLSDGRRQIGAFHLPGDIFGFENGGVHRFSAEAVTQSTVRLIKRHTLDAIAQTDAVVWRTLLSITTIKLQHAENHMLLLGRKTALERVAAFLHEMDVRLMAVDVMSLPMSRRDIADYLGLTIETVSRAVSQLHSDGVLDFIGNTQREIMILDRRRLASFDLQG